MPTATIDASVVVSDPVTLPTAEIAVFREEPTPEKEIVYVEVTAVPTPTPHIVTEYREIYIEVTREVQTILEVAPVPTVTPTATPPLAAGTVQICVTLEGARAVYIGQIGVVSGGCQTFGFGIGQTSIPVQINR